MRNDLSRLAEVVRLPERPTPETSLSSKTIFSIRKRIEEELEAGTMPLSGVVTITDPREPSRVLLTIILEKGSIVSSSHPGGLHEYSTSEQEEGSERSGNERDSQAILPASGGEG